MTVCMAWSAWVATDARTSPYADEAAARAPVGRSPAAPGRRPPERNEVAMAVRTLQAEPVLLAGAELAEGPRWDARTQRLLWVDILAGAVHAFDPVSCGDVRRDLGRHVGAVAPYGEDGLVAAVREGIVRLNADGSEQVLAPVLAEHPGLRFNDGRADRAGRFWADTLSYR